MRKFCFNLKQFAQEWDILYRYKSVGICDFRPLKNQDGFGLVETLASVGILAGVLVIAIAYFPKTRESQTKFSSTSSCTDIAAGVMTQIKELDNSLVVRNWLPKDITAVGNANIGTDPYCNNGGGRTPACEGFSVIRPDPVTPAYVAVDAAGKTDIRGYLNVRGSFVWAQNVYNTYRAGNEICTGDGKILTAAELGNLMPAQTANIPTRLATNEQDPIDYRLFMQDTTVANCAQSQAQNAVISIRLTVRYRSVPNAPLSTCTSTQNFAHNVESSPPVTNITRVYTANGDLPGAGQVPIPGTGIPGIPYCTDRRLVGAGAGSDLSRQTVSIDMNAAEPGSILLCRKDSSFEFDTAGRWQNCANFSVAGAVTAMSTGENVIGFSRNPAFTNPTTTMTLSNLTDHGPARTGVPYVLRVKAVDTSGNETVQPVLMGFNVGVPTCPSTDTYCPDARPPDDIYWANNPIPQPWWGKADGTNYDIWVVPWDTCHNGRCPMPGTHAACGNTSYECQGVPVPNVCGNMTGCTGSRAPSCSGVDVTDIECGVVIPGDCGANCTGTRPDCVGADRNATACCNPVPGRCGADCTQEVGGLGLAGCPPSDPGAAPGPIGLATCDDPANHPCNTFYADSDGNADRCGPGCQGCPSCIPCGGSITPVPDCSGYNQATTPCGQMGPDSSGNPGVCGPPGLQGCPPAKPDWFSGATWIEWECSAFGQGDRFYCPWTLNSGDELPADYMYYAVEWYIRGHRHGNCNNSSLYMTASAWGMGGGSLSYPRTGGCGGAVTATDCGCSPNRCGGYCNNGPNCHTDTVIFADGGATKKWNLNGGRPTDPWAPRGASFSFYPSGADGRVRLFFRMYASDTAPP
jgi:hypothetical protein